MSPALLNTIGLTLGIAGVVVLFIYGPLQPDLQEGGFMGLEDGTVMSDGRTLAEHDEGKHRLRKRHSSLSKAGLALVAAGFAFQLWAVWA
jgi:hypothetical protein